MNPQKTVEIYSKLELPVESLTEALPSILDNAKTEAVLFTSKRPSKGWHTSLTSWKPYLLSSSALFEQIFWVSDRCPGPFPPVDLVRECQALIKDYKGLFEAQGSVDDCALWLAYRNRVLEHIDRDESEIFPKLSAALPVERALRELHYEHLGLQKYLASFPKVLAASRQGTLSSKERERFDLDFFHLLEHHLERELQAVYPILNFLKLG